MANGELEDLDYDYAGPDMFERLRAAVGRNVVMPAGKFFRPNEHFWRLLKSMDKATNFVDTGAGTGHVMAEALDKHGLRMLAIDIRMREQQDPRVLPIDALKFDWRHDIWPVICRPNHDGWCAEVVTLAQATGATALYVGLDDNVDQDIGEFNYVRLDPVVGRDGEHLFVLAPRRVNQQQKPVRRIKQRTIRG